MVFRHLASLIMEILNGDRLDPIIFLQGGHCIIKNNRVLFAQLNGCIIFAVKWLRKMEFRRDVFQAIADPTRRAILGLVALQAMTPGAIADNFASKRQTISKHIQILYECDLLRQTQKGREIHYQINALKMKEIADWIAPYKQLWESRFDALEDLLKEMQNEK